MDIYNIIRKSFYLILILLLISHFFIIQSLGDQSSSYIRLFNDSYNDLLNVYNESRLHNTSYFFLALNQGFSYPLHSFTLLEKCRGELFSNHLTNITSINEAYMSLLGNRSNMENIIMNTLSLPHCYASYEWICLSKEKLTKVDAYLSLAEDAIYEEQYDIVQMYLYYGYYYLSLSKYYHNQSINIQQNTDNLFSISEIVASINMSCMQWIQLCEDQLDYIEQFHPIAKQNTARTLYTESLDYYHNQSYYLALMKAAESIAYAQYLSGSPRFTSKEKASEYAHVYLEMANLTMGMVYAESRVDAPLAQLNFETASLHASDISLTNGTAAAGSIASLSIKESMIAMKQAQAALSITIEKDPAESQDNKIDLSTIEDSEISIQENMVSLGRWEFVSILTVLILVNSIILVYIVKKFHKSP